MEKSIYLFKMLTIPQIRKKQIKSHYLFFSPKITLSTRECRHPPQNPTWDQNWVPPNKFDVLAYTT